MNLFTDIRSLGSLEGPLHLAIGVFDGLHPGHQAVIQQAIEQREKSGGTVVVITFHPHPINVLCPEKAPRILTSTEHKARLLSEVLQVRNLLAIPFSREFSQLTGEAFIRRVVEASSSIGSISVGKDFQFGKDRSGNVALLESMGKELGFEVFAADLVEVDGEVVSSTKIREAIENGEFEAARLLLGRDYTVLGTVIKGRQMGRTIGFPTANLTVHSEQLPPTGVYAVRAVGMCDSWDGVANLGYRPTVEGGDEKRLLEVHLFGLEYEIYGEDIEVEFVEFIRGEKKFDGLDQLKAQIASDVERAREILGRG